jgi:PIN domain nuclease of toxin-antitoxin system
MKLLLDTHAFLWSITSGPVSEQARIAFLNTENELFLSAASYWEISIKVSIGKLVLENGWQKTFEREMQLNGIKWLPIEKSHCHEVLTLPFHHSDPFDRMLIAQALCEEMTLVTVDGHIKQYAVQTLW